MTTQTECAHHFIIPTPEKDRQAVGVCKLCGRERKMNNSITISYWRKYAVRNVKGDRPTRKKRSNGTYESFDSPPRLVT